MTISVLNSGCFLHPPDAYIRVCTLQELVAGMSSWGEGFWLGRDEEGFQKGIESAWRVGGALRFRYM